jgi:altronate dehydratase large subunit
MQIARSVPGAIAFCHSNGCGQLGQDLEQTYRVLAGAGAHPNAGAVLVVSLGCEAIASVDLYEEISQTGKPTAILGMQEEGGSVKALRRGRGLARELAGRKETGRVGVDFSEITLSVRAGGSDATSGLIANPVVGVVADRVVAEGGTVIMSGTSEFLGAEHLLKKRAGSKDIAAELDRIVRRVLDEAGGMGVDLLGTQPGPGNIRGGISTIEEKSLGAVYLGGTTPVREVLGYGERPSRKGLVIMDTPGVGVESNTAAQAAGSQIILFTTGRGALVGAPLAPVLKVTGNTETYRSLADDIDFDAAAVCAQTGSIEEAGDALFRELLAVLSGKRTRAEELGHWEAVITRSGPSI